MARINPASIKNTAGEILQAVMTHLIPAINDNDARIERLEQKLEAYHSPVVEVPPPAPEPEPEPDPANPKVVDATPVKSAKKAAKKKTAKNK